MFDSKKAVAGVACTRGEARQTQRDTQVQRGQEQHAPEDGWFQEVSISRRIRTCEAIGGLVPRPTGTGVALMQRTCRVS
ncbi:hypothetical protein EYF80_015261 [Liparis tanakae]|uniref:Uncharacterized protein n=1 Tax=Liparis tanakae TaxID=230148 RepID=A0A4Z2I9Q8_9TELE|nr:hypothetical protein EYF80_015261 [Liparis tanakae]